MKRSYTCACVMKRSVVCVRVVGFRSMDNLPVCLLGLFCLHSSTSSHLQTLLPSNLLSVGCQVL